MPTVFPPAKTSNKPGTVSKPVNNKPSSTAPTSAVAPPPPQRYNNQPYGAGWNDPYMGGDFDNNYGSNDSGNSKRMTPAEREEMIKRLYQEVLGREATSRDINYHKYGVSGEDELRKQLLSNPEHKEMVSDARKYKELKGSYDKIENRNKQMEAQIKDQIEEFKKLLQLLNEKNRYIEKLRRELNNPYNIAK